MAATITTANSGAGIENAALPVLENGSNDTVTKSRLAKAKPRRTIAQRMRSATFRKRIIQASSARLAYPSPAQATATVPTALNRLSRAVETLAHFFTGFEERRQFLGHRNLVAGARIAPGAGLSLFGRERAEAAQLDALSASESIRDLAEDGVDNVLDVTLIKMRIAGRHALHELRLDHRMSPTRNASAFASP